MTARRPGLIALGLALLSAGAALADPCPGGETALHAAIARSLTDDAALLKARGVGGLELEASPAEVVALMAETFALTPSREHLLIYSQTDTGLCALVFDGQAVIAASGRPGQTTQTLTTARLALSDALRVTARQVERAGQLRGAAALTETANDPPDAGTAAALLADRLMLPDLAPALTGADEILILPTQDIGTVPFALLPLADGMVIDHAPVTVLPSVAALVRQPDMLTRGLSALPTTAPVAFTPVWTGAVVVGDPEAADDPDWAFPPLPGARSEARLIADRFGTSPLIGPDATPDAVLTALSQPVDLVYFAAHGISSDADPLTHSFLALSGGRLTAGQVQTLSLPNHPLVVLSACQSGLGQSHAGGTIGLSRAFVLAGASAVVSTLWNVNDRATLDLMRDFSAALTDQRPTDALRQAMLAARDRSPDDPALWAGVMLFGGISLLAD